MDGSTAQLDWGLIRSRRTVEAGSGGHGIFRCGAGLILMILVPRENDKGYSGPVRAHWGYRSEVSWKRRQIIHHVVHVQYIITSSKLSTRLIL